MSSIKPLSCPSCGTAVQVTFGKGNAGRYANIRCSCGMQTRPIVGDEKEAERQVIAIWNGQRTMNEAIKNTLSDVAKLPIDERVEAINEIRRMLKEISPFNDEPVDCIQWVREDLVIANDYNPNSVAPPEMELLHTSIQEDGYTQPIVVFNHDGIYEVVDGFHRNRVGKEYEDIRERIHGYVPVTVINDDRHDKADRIASTIRHNRARGKHQVEKMSDIVIDLKRRNWSDEKIGRELGMDPDEVLRLTQITGLAEMFADQEFSEAWEVDLDSDDIDFSELEDEE